MISCFIEHGVLLTYEEESGTSSFLILAGVVISLDGYTKPHWEWLLKVLVKILAETKHDNQIREDTSALVILKWSIAVDTEHLIKALLNSGVNVHTRINNLSALELACQPNVSCSSSSFRMLLGHADQTRLDERNPSGKGLGLVHYLGVGYIHEQLEKFRQLLDKGADCNLRTAGGAPALVFHALHNSSDTATLLLGHGANWSLKASCGWDLALAAASRGLLQLLE